MLSPRLRRYRGLSLGRSIFLTLACLACMSLLRALPAASQPVSDQSAFGIPASGRISVQELHTALREVDRLLDEGLLQSASRALDRLQGGGATETQLLMRRIRLYDASGDYPAMIAACRRGLKQRSGNKRLHFNLIAALVSADSLDMARSEVESYLGGNALNYTNAAGLIDLWRKRGYPREGLDLSRNLREKHADPRLFARNRAQCLAVLERYGDAAAEFLKVLQINPLDIIPVRRDLREFVVGKTALEAFLIGLRVFADRQDSGVSLLSIDTALYLGRETEATEIYNRHDWSVREIPRLLRLVRILSSELGMYTDMDRARATGLWLLDVLGPRGLGGDLAPSRKTDVPEILASVCTTLLAGIVPAPDLDASGSDAFLSRIRDALIQVQNDLPQSETFFLAQIRLADYQRKVRGDPATAITDLQLLLKDQNLPIAGLARARLSLGKSYLAVADTAAARNVLGALTVVEHFVDVGIEAEYLLSLLDIAQGHWEAGQERLAALAKKYPGSDLANDALGEGLRIAELLLEPDLDETLRDAYARSVFWELVDRPLEQIADLSLLARLGVDIGSPASVSTAEHARMDLARLQAGRGRSEAAIAQCDTLIANHPDGRYPARAMLLKAGLQAAVGNLAGAARTRDILLVQYPDTPQAELARLDLEK